MRACRLGLVDSTPSQLARLLVEPLERRLAAAILLDGSCLLVPLPSISGSSGSSGGGSSSQPVALRAPPCSDACFLRLHMKEANSSQGKVQLQFGQFGPTAPVLDTPSEGKLGRSFFLLASPSRGGSCTDVRAWSCDGGLIKQVALEEGVLGVSRGNSTPGLVARFEIPHGVSVKMTASVNAVALYSPSGGKLYILAAKAQQSSEGKGNRKPSLLLMNTAVIDCGGLVCTMHLSTQHLILGDAGGVRVLPLRPLVKGRKVEAKHNDCNGNQVHGNHREELIVKPKSRMNGLYKDEVVRMAVKNGFACNENQLSEKDEAFNLATKLSDWKLDEDVTQATCADPQTRSTVLPNSLKVATSVYATLSESRQVLSIHAVSTKSFLVLDSAGVLYWLMLKKPQQMVKGRTNSGDVQVDARRVEIPFAVSTFAVLPSETTSGGATKIWASDGKYSVHVLLLPEEIASHEEGPIVPSVIQAIFLGSPTSSLVGLSPETVLAITGDMHLISGDSNGRVSSGTLVAYVKAGT